jgi:hypothetical protein
VNSAFFRPLNFLAFLSEDWSSRNQKEERVQGTTVGSPEDYIQRRETVEV